MPDSSIFAALDLGSNSFRLQFAKVLQGELHLTESVKKTIRLAAGLNSDNILDEEVQRRALTCLELFKNKLNGLSSTHIRAVATNTLRVAKNSRKFIQQAEAALGVPIEVISGEEEGRLIYLGVANSLPQTKDPRLVVDIGGGSTEFIIGHDLMPQRVESLNLGCLTFTQQFFPFDKITRDILQQAEQAAMKQIRNIAPLFAAGQWRHALGSSGTAKTLADVLRLNGYCNDGISTEGLNQLRETVLSAGNISHLKLDGIDPLRIAVLIGGFSIMAAVFNLLQIDHMTVARGALREGILHDMINQYYRGSVK